MNHKNVRRGKTQSEFNESASSFLFSEVFIISGISGLITSSWVVFGAILLLTIFLLFFRQAAITLTILLTLLWTVVGVLLGFYLGNILGSIIFGIIALLASAGMHLGAIEWMDDMGYREEEEQ